MDFRHLIVTCLFSMLRLSFETQKIKKNYAILPQNTRMFYPNTSPCFALKHPDVLGSQSYGVYSSVPTSFMLSPGISSSGT